MMSGDIWREVYDSENAIAALSGKRLEDIIPRTNDSTSAPPDESFLTVRVLSEQAIKTELLRLLGETGRGDSLSMAMFYLTEREVMRSLLDAAERGAVVRIILDPSKDAFGYDKHGIPNRQAAAELVRKSGQAIKIRWQNTHGEQFHAKLVSVRKTDGTSALLLGSANLTRRNIRGYNLELDVRISGSSDAACMERTSSFFERLWSNEAGDPYTLDYEAYEDTSLLKTMLYRVYEYAGLSTF